MKPKAPFADCEHCPLNAEPFVSGVGRDDAKYVIVGEAPGSTEVKTGVPFTGPSGQLLKKVLTPHDIDRNTDAFVTNTVLCRPPPKVDGRDNPPPALAIKACRRRLIDEIRSHKPYAVLALGGPSARTLLGSREGIRLLRGGYKQSPYFDPPVVATFHPAAREPGKLAVMISDVGTLVTCGETASPMRRGPPEYSD